MLIDGFAYRQKLTGSGDRQIISLHVPGDVLDLQNLYLDVSDHNMQTLTRAEVAYVPRAALREIVTTHPAISHAVLVASLIDASILREWILNIGRRDSRSRIAHLLCEFAVRLDATRTPGIRGYDLPMTQEQLGDALGLTAVHVNRMLKALETDGLIVRNKRSIGFPDVDALRDVADFSARYLHLDQQLT